jgi:hypothetical protein
MLRQNPEPMKLTNSIVMQTAALKHPLDIYASKKWPKQSRALAPVEQ